MRAILVATASYPRLNVHLDDLRAVFQANHWLVTDQTRAEHILNEVLDDVAPGDVERVRPEYLFSLEKTNHTVTGILGFVSEDQRVEIRLIGDTTTAIKFTCSEMVELLVKADRDAAAGAGVRFGFQFIHEAGIFSKTTKEQMWVGVVRPDRNVWRYAFGEERGQARVVKWGTAFFFVGLVITFPRIAHAILPLAKENFDWATGHVARLSSASLFAAVVAILNVQLRVQELKRDGTIIWRHV